MLKNFLDMRCKSNPPSASASVQHYSDVEALHKLTRRSRRC